jgi:hypothetical protein
MCTEYSVTVTVTVTVTSPAGVQLVCIQYSTFTQVAVSPSAWWENRSASGLKYCRVRYGYQLRSMDAHLLQWSTTTVLVYLNRPVLFSNMLLDAAVGATYGRYCYAVEYPTTGASGGARPRQAWIASGFPLSEILSELEHAERCWWGTRCCCA